MRTTALLFIFILTFSLAACGEVTSEPADAGTPSGTGGAAQAGTGGAAGTGTGGSQGGCPLNFHYDGTACVRDSGATGTGGSGTTGTGGSTGAPGMDGCPTGQHFGGTPNTPTMGCVAQGTCSKYYHLDGTANDMCVPGSMCATGYQNDPQTNTCVPAASPITCPTGQHNSGQNTCVPAGFCNPGYHDGGDGNCLPIGQCSVGTQWPMPYYHDGGNGNCLKYDLCASGYHITGPGTCAPDPCTSNSTCGGLGADCSSMACQPAYTCRTVSGKKTCAQ